MIQRKIAVLAVAGLMSTGLTSCFKNQCSGVLEYTKYEPVYESYEAFRAKEIKAEEPRAVQYPGKIYLKGSKLYINEAGKGVHVFNNMDPNNPEPLAFIPIVGNFDIVISGRTMFADSHVDLIALDISDLNNINIISRSEDVFPYNDYINNVALDPNKGVVTDWVIEEVVEEVSCRDSRLGLRGSDWGWGTGAMMEADLATAAPRAGSGAGVTGGGRSGEATSGKGGSMARFALEGNKLYTVNESSLRTFDVSNPASPILENDADLGWGIETIFPYRDHLFIGSMTGMHVFNMENPSSPEFVSTYSHMTACDPVVVEENRAYVTIRTGRTCQGWQNQLHIIDIENLQNPILISAHDMFNPHGLGVVDGTLYLCDGDAGFKVFDVTNDETIVQKQHYQNINAFDVIPYTQSMVMIGTDGLYQYDYSDPDNISLLSVIPTGE